MKRILMLIQCFFAGHARSGKVCTRCKTEFGVPKMENIPAPPPKRPTVVTDNSMEEELKVFFASTEFYRRFDRESISRHENPDRLSITYRFKIPSGRNLRIRFFKFQGIKSFEVHSEGRMLIEMIYFRNNEELTLLLNRVAGVRSANPLSTIVELREA